MPREGSSRMFSSAPRRLTFPEKIPDAEHVRPRDRAVSRVRGASDKLQIGAARAQRQILPMIETAGLLLARGRRRVQDSDQRRQTSCSESTRLPFRVGRSRCCILLAELHDITC